MPLSHTVQSERLAQARRAALQQAAQQGWDDIAAGRFVEVADDQLDDFIGQLGRNATTPVKPAGST